MTLNCTDSAIPNNKMTIYSVEMLIPSGDPTFYDRLEKALLRNIDGKKNMRTKILKKSIQNVKFVTMN